MDNDVTSGISFIHPSHSTYRTVKHKQMKLDKIFYQRNFPIGQFLFETIGLGATIDEGDNQEQCLDELKRQVIEYHEKNMPVIDDTQTGMYVKQISEPTAKLSAKEQIINDIGTCSEIKVLESYRLIAKSDIQVQQAYDNQLKKLTDAN